MSQAMNLSAESSTQNNALIPDLYLLFRRTSTFFSAAPWSCPEVENKEECRQENSNLHQ